MLIQAGTAFAQKFPSEPHAVNVSYMRVWWKERHQKEEDDRMHASDLRQINRPGQGVPAPLTSQPSCLSSFIGIFQRGWSRVGPLSTMTAGHTTLVQPQQTQQQFEGWGTSLCWWANVVGGFPDPLRDQLMDLVFSPKTGLGLEICRYNIGGSGWSNLDTKNFRYGADLPSFWGPDGTWDWEQDANQRWVLLQARERGATIFEAFSNSPPYWMTYSGRASGNRFAWLDNLRPDRYDDFIFYLTEVCKWYKDTHGLVFRTLDPFNEPSSNYWWAGNNQEGCHFGVSTQNVILVKLQNSLMKAGLLDAGLRISGSDETSIDVQCQTMYGYSPAALGCLTQINTHCYQGSRRQELRDLVRAAGKRLWMSEVGFGGHPVDDIWSGLDISRCILNDLNVMQVNAWVYWQAIENSDSPTWWGLLQVPFHTGASITIGKQFYCMLQYTRFIKSGWTILTTNRPDTTLAAASPSDSKHQAIVLVVSNFDGAERTDQFDLTSFKGDASVEVYRTSAQENFSRVTSFDVPEPVQFSLTLPPSSITTLVVRVASVSDLAVPRI